MPAGLVALVARRRADQLRDRVLLHVLGHVEAQERPLVVVQRGRERLRELRLADARRTEKHERRLRLLRILEPHARDAHGVRELVDDVILAEDAGRERLVEIQELRALVLIQLAHGDAGELAELREHVLRSQAQAFVDLPGERHEGRLLFLNHGLNLVDLGPDPVHLLGLVAARGRAHVEGLELLRGRGIRRRASLAHLGVALALLLELVLERADRFLTVRLVAMELVQCRLRFLPGRFDRTDRRRELGAQRLELLLALALQRGGLLAAVERAGDLGKLRLLLREAARARVRLLAIRRQRAVEQVQAALRLRAAQARLAHAVLRRELDRGVDGVVVDRQAVVPLEAFHRVAHDEPQRIRVGLGEIEHRVELGHVRMALQNDLEIGIARLEDRLELAAVDLAHQRVDEVRAAVVARGFDEVAHVLDDQQRVGIARELAQQLLEVLVQRRGVARGEQAVGVEPEDPLVDDVERRARILARGLEPQAERGAADAARADEQHAVRLAPHENSAEAPELAVAAHELEVGAAREVVRPPDQEALARLLRVHFERRASGRA